MEQEELFFESIEDALRDDIKKHGGFKKLGSELRPTKTPADAATWLRNGTNANQDDAIDYRELLHILDKALSNRRSSFLVYLGQQYGFTVKWKEPQNELVELIHEIRAARVADRAREDRFARMLERAEALAANQAVPR